MTTDPLSDSCPACGGRMQPVLESTPSSGGSGLLTPDSPVHLRCPTCNDTDEAGVSGH